VLLDRWRYAHGPTHEEHIWRDEDIAHGDAISLDALNCERWSSRFIARVASLLA
jgi:hypothetical protein